MRSAKEAVAYMKKLHTLVRYLGICDGNMQEGSFRCDANVSVRRAGAREFGTRAEIKNLNSFRFVEQAINYEVARQIELLEDGGKVVQETRLYDPDKGETRSMRSKEEAHDYRYFPDPDLLPVMIDAAFIECGARDTAGAPRSEGRTLRARSTGCRPTMRACSPRAASWPSTTRRWSRTVPKAAEARGQLGHGRARSKAQSRRARGRGSARCCGRARSAGAAHRRPHHLRQHRQGGVRGHVGGGLER